MMSADPPLRMCAGTRRKRGSGAFAHACARASLRKRRKRVCVWQVKGSEKLDGQRGFCFGVEERELLPCQSPLRPLHTCSALWGYSEA
eukprot:5445686-Pleurochrysis_carterae.AAC.1